MAGARTTISAPAPRASAGELRGRELLGAGRRRAAPPPRAPRASARATPRRPCATDRASALRRCAKARPHDARNPLARPRRHPLQPQERRPDPRSRTENRGIDGAQQLDAAGELDEHARRAVRLRPRPAPAAGRRSRAAPSPSSAARRAAPRSCAAGAASRSSTAGSRPSRVGGGSNAARSMSIASPKCSSTPGSPRRQLLQARPQPLIQLDHVHGRAARPRAAR